MTNYPNSYDDDSTLPPVNDNIDQIGGDAINALRDAVVAIEMALGTNIAGVQPNLAARLGVFINPDGTPNASIIYSLGLVTLPIYDDAIAPTAGIQESKLKLDYRTQDLFNYIRDLSRDVNLALGWISVSGIKVEPHLMGAIYRHDLAQIDVAENSSQFLNNVFRVLRNNTDAYTLLNDMNNELLAHQWADGSPFGIIKNIITNDGSTYPSNYAHVASGIFLDTTGFAIIPQTAINEQLAWDWIDKSGILTPGNIIQNLYASGISVNSRSSSLTTDGYGQPLVPPTPAIAYLRDTGSASFPFDDIAMGDDIIQFFPSPDDGYTFDEQFALVRVGDIVRVNYANDGYFIEVPYVISEKKYIPGNPATSSTFIVRIAGKNIAYSPNAIARIDKTLFNNNKKGVLAISGVNSTNLPSGTTPSLVVASPRGAQCIGVGFSPDEFNETHYLLYLALYPTGNPLDGYQILPAIDVTGNAGSTPGNYTLSNIVNATNQNFRKAGFNYRFVAFEYEGEFGIMLADSYNNASFSVINGVVTSQGFYNQSLSQLNFPNNVIDLFPSGQTVTTGSTLTLPVSIITVASTAGFNNSGTLSIITSSNGVQAVTYTGISGNTFTGCSGGTGSVPAGSQVSEQLLNIAAPDPLGFGPFGAGVSSPPFMGGTAYGTFAAAAIPTVIWPPLRRNNYYVNGTEQEKLANYVNDGQVQDQYGDGYWIAKVQSINPGVNNVSVTYLIPLDLSVSGLKAGKTLVVQPVDGYNFGSVNYGRFIISNVTFTCCPPVQTQITVYDAVHGTGVSPYSVLSVGSEVAIYFNNDSVSFNNETATDFLPINLPFKRHFEVYVDDSGNTFTHERARLNPSGTNGSFTQINASFGAPLYGNVSFASMNVYSISPTLRGYEFGNVNKITLNITNFNGSTGEYTGYLCNFNGTNFLNQGPFTTGRIGEQVKFYDQTHSDYVEVVFEFTNPPPNFSNQYIDIQLFPSLALDQDNMILGTVEVNGTVVGQFQDLREFGNISEEQLSISALKYLALPDSLLHFNGVFRGFDFLNNDGAPPPPTQYGSAGFMSLDGGVALANGNIVTANPQTFLIPALVESYLSVNYPINYALCINKYGDLTTIILTDYDPILGTPNAAERIVTVTNLVSSTTYQVGAKTFSDLLNTSNDLTPLYVVSAVATGAGTSAATVLTNIRDVRRFVDNSDVTGPAVLSTNSAQGNFNQLSAALNWLNFNANYQNTLLVKGAFSESADPGFTFPLTIEAAASVASLTVSASVTMSNVTFDGITLVFQNNLTATNTVFNNCHVTVNKNTTLTNVTFNNCTIILGGTNVWSGVIIDPSSVTLSGSVTVNNCNISNTTFTVNVALGFVLGSANNFQSCTFLSTINPLGTGGYNTVDLVNGGSGLMYASVGSGTNLIGLTVNNCVFTNQYTDHFPFISLQLSSTSSYVQNVSITENQFTSKASNNDIRAVIAINTTTIATGTHGALTYPAFPKLVDVNISNNICNYDQMIIMSTARNAGQPITGAMLTCVGCKISDNVCGTIAYMTAADFVSNGNNSEIANVGYVKDKLDQLSIQNNTVKLITNLDSTGQFISFFSSDASVQSNWVQVGTGACVIEGNTSYWILVGAASWSQNNINYTNANAVGIDIIKNRLSPADPSYLTSYTDVAFSNVTPPNIGCHLRQGTYQRSDFQAMQSIIADNIMDTRTWLESINGSYNFYNYAIGIKCENSSNIYGNSLNRVINSNSAPMVYLGGTSSGGPIINMHDNNLVRGSNIISAYVQAAANNAVNTVIIQNNIFDSTVIDNGSNTNVGLNIPNSWVFRNNKNQTFYVEMALLDQHANISNSGGIGAFSTSGPVAANFVHYTAESGNFYITTAYNALTGPVNAILPPNGYNVSSQYVVFNDVGVGASTSNVRTFSVDLPVDKFVPPGTTIVNAQLGCVMAGTNGSGQTQQLDDSNPIGGTSTYNGISITLVSYNNILTSNGTKGVLNINNNLVAAFLIGSIDYSANNAVSGSYYINTTAAESNLKSAVQYITADASGQNFITGNNYRVMVEISTSYKRNATGTQNNFVIVLSPVVLTCVYG